MGIVDFSFVTEFALSSNLIRQLAEQEPGMPDATSRPCLIVAPKAQVFGLARMFQILGEPARPRLSVVHSLDLGVCSTRRSIPSLRAFGVTVQVS